MNLRRLLGNQIMVAIVFATMLLFSGFVFEGSEEAQTIMMLIIALYFSVMAAVDKRQRKHRLKSNCQNSSSLI
ncbi:MAG: hypothetical protein OQJ89_13950 [Kangiellaceae bacterium]|nr:hypothetical protein [Kangiellaceae bacterium]MCW9018069.1 hypothetical protein [Kangiellaceae bacterium]